MHLFKGSYNDMFVIMKFLAHFFSWQPHGSTLLGFHMSGFAILIPTFEVSIKIRKDLKIINVLQHVITIIQVFLWLCEQWR